MSGWVILLEPKGTILEVARVAKERGLSVAAIVSDNTLLDNTPTAYLAGRESIDTKINIESWSDPHVADQILNQIHSLSPIVGIYSGVDPCAKVAASLRKKFGLPTVSPENIETILNKHLLRKKLIESGLSNLKTFHQNEVDQWVEWKIKGAAYFKPVHGFFSAYVTRCENLDDLKIAKQRWLSGNPNDSAFVSSYLRRTGQYHIEQAIDGELLSVEAISFGGQFLCLGLLSRILYSQNKIVEMGSCFPYPHPRAKEIIDLVRKAHSVLGFTEGPSHTEVIVGKDGAIEIIDFNPRFVGADVLQSINNAHGIKIEESLLDWASGKTPVVRPTQEFFSCLQYVLPPFSLAFQSIDLPNAPEVKFGASFLKPGTILKSIDRQLDYVGCYLTVMPTFQSALERSRVLRNSVRINGTIEGAY